MIGRYAEPKVIGHQKYCRMFLTKLNRVDYRTVCGTALLQAMSVKSSLKNKQETQYVNHANRIKHPATLRPPPRHAAGARAWLRLLEPAGWHYWTSGEAEANTAVAQVRRPAVAASGAAVPADRAPRAAAQHTPAFIIRLALIIRGIKTTAPFPNISPHIIQPQRIGAVAPHRRGSCRMIITPKMRRQMQIRFEL